MSREVMKLALEALEDLIEAGAEAWGEQRPCVRIGREVATTLREALAKPEQDSAGTLNISRFKGHLVNNDFDYFGERPVALPIGRNNYD